jgi:flagellin-like protein
MRHLPRTLYLTWLNRVAAGRDRGEVSVSTAVLAVLFIIIAVALAGWATGFIGGWEGNAPVGP